MADKKTLSPEEKKLAAEKHVDELVQKALVALEEMRKLDQEQVDYIVAKASVAALDAHGELALLQFPFRGIPFQKGHGGRAFGCQTGQ